MSAGPLFWVHLSYLDVLMLGATGAFIVSLLRRSRAYGLQAAVLTGAALLPWVTNLGYNFDIDPLAQVDLTPVAFTVAAAVLAWGMFRQHLLRLAPVAYRQVVAGMSDAVFAAGHVRSPGGDQPRRRARCWDPARAPAAGGARCCPSGCAPWAVGGGPGEVSLDVDGAAHDFEVQASELPDRRGRPKGRLLVLRDVTDRRRSERELAAAHAAQSGIADTLSRSLRPDVLPAPAGVALAAAYRPAGLGHEIGGDFYDVFACGPGWGFAIGDVSGKGAPAAAVTALARYTLRALSTRHILAAARRRPAQRAPAHQRHRGDVPHRGARPLHARPENGHGDLRPGRPPAPAAGPRGRRGRCSAVGRAGTAVGLVTDTSLHETTVCLGPGDALLFYTDGVTEARRGDEFFGEEGLAAGDARHGGRLSRHGHRRPGAGRRSSATRTSTPPTTSRSWSSRRRASRRRCSRVPAVSSSPPEAAGPAARRTSPGRDGAVRPTCPACRAAGRSGPDGYPQHRRGTGPQNPGPTRP